MTSAVLAPAGFVDRPVDDPLGGFAYFGLSDVEVVHGVCASWTYPAEGV